MLTGSLFQKIQTSLLTLGFTFLIAPPGISAQPTVPITEIRWFNVNPVDRWQDLRFTVPDQDTTVLANGGKLRRYDAHLAWMFEISHYLCQRQRQVEGYQWQYEAANGNVDMGTFRISCRLARDIATAYGFSGSERAVVQKTSVSFNQPLFREVWTVPKLNLVSTKASRWMEFVQKFPPTSPVDKNRTMQPLPLATLVPQLKRKTTVPILLPGEIFRFDLPIDYDLQGDRDRYELSLYLTPGCRAGACYVSSFVAERQGKLTPVPEITELHSRDTFRNIQLANGIEGIFVNVCGAYCTAAVEWQFQGVVYRVVGRNSYQPDLVKLANLAIQAGVR